MNLGQNEMEPQVVLRNKRTSAHLVSWGHLAKLPRAAEKPEDKHAHGYSLQHNSCQFEFLVLSNANLDSPLLPPKSLLVLNMINVSWRQNLVGEASGHTVEPRGHHEHEWCGCEGSPALPPFAAPVDGGDHYVHGEDRKWFFFKNSKHLTSLIKKSNQNKSNI